MKFIETIEIKNFKSIRHQKIEGCKKINVFIGYPNVGKSNILEALSLFSIDSTLKNFASLVRVEKGTTLFFNGEISTPLDVILNKNYRYRIKYSNEGLTVINQIDDKNIGFQSIDDQYSAKDSIGEISRFLFTNDNTINGFTVNGQNQHLLFSTVKKYDFVKNITNRKAVGDRLIDPNGYNIFDIILINKKINKEVQELFKKYDLEIIYEAREQKFAILKRTSAGIFSIPYELIADTLQRLIFYKAAILSNTDTVLIFEEPEAQMFPPYIKKLTTDILFDKTNQFFLATHSPYVLDELILEGGDDLSVYLVDYKDGETVVHYLSNDDLSEIRQYGVDLFFNIESYLKHGQVNNS